MKPGYGHETYALAGLSNVVHRSTGFNSAAHAQSMIHGLRTPQTIGTVYTFGTHRIGAPSGMPASGRATPGQDKQVAASNNVAQGSGVQPQQAGHGGSYVANSKHLVEPLLAAAAGSFGDGLRMHLDESHGSRRFSISFDNSVLKPRVGKHLTCAWRAAIRCATQEERPLSDHVINRRSRAIEFSGADLLDSIGGDQDLYRQIRAAYFGAYGVAPPESAAKGTAVGGADMVRRRNGSTDSMVSAIALRSPPVSSQAISTAAQRTAILSSSASAAMAPPSPASSSLSRGRLVIPTAPPPEPQYLVPQYLSQPFINGKNGTFGEGLTLQLGPTPRSPWSIRFDNRVLNPRIGFIKSGGWRAAVRRVAESEEAIVKNGASVRVVEFKGDDLYTALRGCRSLLADLGYQGVSDLRAGSGRSIHASGEVEPPNPSSANIGNKRGRASTWGSSQSQSGGSNAKRARTQPASTGTETSTSVGLSDGCSDMIAVAGLHALASASGGSSPASTPGSAIHGPWAAHGDGPGQRGTQGSGSGQLAAHWHHQHHQHQHHGVHAGQRMFPGSFPHPGGMLRHGQPYSSYQPHQHFPSYQQHQYQRIQAGTGMHPFMSQGSAVLDFEGTAGALHGGASLDAPVPGMKADHRAHVQAQLQMQQMQISERLRQLEHLRRMEELQRMQAQLQEQQEQQMLHKQRLLQFQQQSAPASGGMRSNVLYAPALQSPWAQPSQAPSPASTSTMVGTGPAASAMGATPTISRSGTPMAPQSEGSAWVARSHGAPGTARPGTGAFAGVTGVAGAGGGSADGKHLGAVSGSFAPTSSSSSSSAMLPYTSSSGQDDRT